MEAYDAPGCFDHVRCPLTWRQPVPAGEAGAALLDRDAAHSDILHHPGHGSSAARTAPDPLCQVANLWWFGLVSGVFWIVVALVVLQFDQASVTTVGVLIGIMFLVAGAQNFLFGSLAGGALQRILWIFAVLFVIAGVISLISPEDTFAGMADILGFLFLLVGVFWLVEAFAERDTNELWWFGLIAGAEMIIVAFWTAGQFFIEKAYVLLVFAGIWALFHGVGDLIRAFQIRKLRDRP